ncbi:unnamed protein product, partial [Didymodactylos carnosus]
SKFLHSWFSVLLRKSRKQTLELNDLYDVLPELDSVPLTDKLESKWFEEIRKAKQENRNPSLVNATLKMIGIKPILVGLLLIPN